MTNGSGEPAREPSFQGKRLAWDERADQRALEAFERAGRTAEEAGPADLRVEAARSRAWVLSRLDRADEAPVDRTAAIQAYRAVFDLDDPHPPPSTRYVDAVEAGLHLARLTEARGDPDGAAAIRERTRRLYRAEEESLAWAPGDSLRLRFPRELRGAIDDPLGE